MVVCMWYTSFAILVKAFHLFDLRGCLANALYILQYPFLAAFIGRMNSGCYELLCISMIHYYIYTSFGWQNNCSYYRSILEGKTEYTPTFNELLK